MLYLIGLGLNFDGISDFGMKVVKKCKKVYLENYTVDFPYHVQTLEDNMGKKTIPANRDFVESLKIVDEAKKQDVALLVYGSPLTATTHITIIQEAKASKVRCKVIHSASILDAVAETGLQLYKFGKTASIPKHDADSFLEIIKENQKIEAHSLLLVDIGMELEDALDKLSKIKTNKVILCSQLGTNKGKIFYKALKDLYGVEVQKPYCFIVPGKLHFMEEEVLKNIE